MEFISFQAFTNILHAINNTAYQYKDATEKYISYLINRQTQYIWNYLTSLSFKTDVRVD